MYKCIVYDEKNNRKTLNLHIDSESEVFSYANDNNLKIVQLKKKRELFQRTRKLKDKDLKIFSKEMSILLKSGCDISKILTTLIKESNKKLKPILQQILKSIEKGNSIKESFESTLAFSKFYISMISAGEMSGNLDEVMDSLSIYYEKERKLKDKIRSILIYPVMLMSALIICFAFMLIFLIPVIEEVYADASLNVPILTKVLIFLSHLVRYYFLQLLVIFAGIIGTFIYFKRSNKKFNDFLNKIKFNFPRLKNYTQLFITNRFIKALSILIASGVQIVDSIEISARVINNQYIYEKINRANELIKRGNGIGESLKTVEELPFLFLSMIVIGEESGKLDTILYTIQKYYENELDSRMEIGMKYIENGMTFVIGIIVGLVVISMMIPMFDAVSAI